MATIKEMSLITFPKEIKGNGWNEWDINEKELHPFLGHMAKHFFELGMQVSYKAQKGE